jgi:P27 family predicted phage terminase small subunit
LQGNPGRRPLPKGEPHPELGVPSRPEWLSAEGKREWNRVVPELARLGLLAKIDRAMIVAYCVCWGMYKDAIKDLEEKGTTFETEKGYQGPRPSVGIAKQALQQAIQLSAKFGFTPSDRAKMAMPEPQDEDPFSAYLRAAKRQEEASGGE